MTAIATETSKTKRAPVPMNGVDTPALLSRIKAVGVQPELAKRYGVSMCSLARAFPARGSPSLPARLTS